MKTVTALIVSAMAAFTADSGTSPSASDERREVGLLVGQRDWKTSQRKGEESPSSPKLVTPGLTGSKQAALFYMREYNSDANTSAEHAFKPISGEKIVVEMMVKPSSELRALTVSVRSDGEAAAYIRFNGKKAGWCQQYDHTSQYRDIASYTPGAENLLKIQLNTNTRKLRAWVNGVGGDEWDFRAAVTMVDRLDLFMSHGNGPEVWTVVDSIAVRDDSGQVVFAENFDNITDSRTKPASAPRSTGDLGISPSGHYITYQGGRPLLLIGDSGTQCVTQNLNLDYRRWIDDCAERGIRAVHVWSFKSPKQKQDGSLVESRYGYVYPGVTPWVRKTTGPAASDQLQQWDLTTFDDGPDGDLNRYWPRLRDLCRHARSKGIVVGITVFFGWPKHNSAQRPDWSFHPLNVVNGGPVTDSGDMATEVQMIASPGTEIWSQPWSDGWPSRQQTQWIWERLCKKYIDDLNGLGNVFFVFMDEHSYREGNGGDHFLHFFTSRGAVWVDWKARRPAVSWVMSDTLHAVDKNSNAVSGFNAVPTKPYIHLEGPPYKGDEVRTSLWSFVMGAGHFFFHADEEQETATTGIMGYDPHVPGGDKGMDKRDWLGHASRFFNEHVADLDAMAPNNDLSGKGTWCLANPGNEYIVYSRIGSPQAFEMDLGAAAGKTLTCRFYDPRTGRFDAPFQRHGGATESFSKPDSRDWVLHVTATNGSPEHRPSNPR